MLALFSALSGANYDANVDFSPSLTKDYHVLENLGVNYESNTRR